MNAPGEFSLLFNRRRHAEQLAGSKRTAGQVGGTGLRGERGDRKEAEHNLHEKRVVLMPVSTKGG